MSLKAKVISSQLPRRLFLENLEFGMIILGDLSPEMRSSFLSFSVESFLREADGQTFSFVDNIVVAKALSFSEENRANVIALLSEPHFHFQNL